MSSYYGLRVSRRWDDPEYNSPPALTGSVSETGVIPYTGKLPEIAEAFEKAPSQAEIVGLIKGEDCGFDAERAVKGSSEIAPAPGDRCWPGAGSEDSRDAVGIWTLLSLPRCFSGDGA